MILGNEASFSRITEKFPSSAFGSLPCIWDNAFRPLFPNYFFNFLLILRPLDPTLGRG
jgi:hypothetical protein